MPHHSHAQQHDLHHLDSSTTSRTRHIASPRPRPRSLTCTLQRYGGALAAQQARHMGLQVSRACLVASQVSHGPARSLSTSYGHDIKHPAVRQALVAEFYSFLTHPATDKAAFHVEQFQASQTSEMDWTLSGSQAKRTTEDKSARCGHIFDRGEAVYRCRCVPPRIRLTATRKLM